MQEDPGTNIHATWVGIGPTGRGCQPPELQNRGNF